MKEEELVAIEERAEKAASTNNPVIISLIEDMSLLFAEIGRLKEEVSDLECELKANKYGL
jgi:hypothetical protein